MITCPGCGRDYPNETAMDGTTEEVNLKDGTRTQLTVCGNTCCDLWDDLDFGPGDWILLEDGREVQRTWWQCGHCQSFYDADFTYRLIDTDYEITGRDPETLRRAETIVCGLCIRKEKGRFLTRDAFLQQG